MAFTLGDDLNILQATDSATMSAGAGNDTYILAPSPLAAGQNLFITDTQGTNTLKLVGGLEIVASRVASDTAQLTLSNGAVVTLGGASSFNFNVGGTALTGGADKSYSAFAQDVLGVTPPASGVVEGGGAFIYADGSVATTPPPTPEPEPVDGFGYTLDYTNASDMGAYFDEVDTGISAALDYWGAQLDTAPGAHINVQVNYAPQAGNTLASAGANWYNLGESFNGEAVYTSAVQQALQTGDNIPYGSVDASISIASMDLSANNWWYDPTPQNRTDNGPSSTQLDFTGVMLHEFGHALGFNSTYGYNPDFEQRYPLKTRFDSWIDSNAAQTEFTFAGPSARQAYAELGGVGDVPLFVEPYMGGSNFAHYGGIGSQAGLLEGMLMNPATTAGEQPDIHALDLAVLEDLGYDIAANAPALANSGIIEAPENNLWLAGNADPAAPEWLI